MYKFSISNNKFQTFFILFLTFFSFVVIHSFIFSDKVFARTNSNLIKIGISDDNAYPYYYKQAGRFFGLEVDLVKQIAQELNLRTQFIAMPFNELGNALQKNEIDLVVSLVSYTEEREQKYALTIPYICTSGTFLFRNQKIKNEFEKNNRNDKFTINIGVNAKTRYNYYADSIANMKNLKVNTFSYHNLILGAFESKKLDMILSEHFLMYNFANQHKSANYVLGDQVFDENLVMLSNKKNQELINKINPIIARMNNDGRLQSLSQKYLKLNLLCK